MEKSVLLDIAIKALGACEALQHSKLSIDVAEQLIFKPKYCREYDAAGADTILINLLWLGTELEDVKSLCPENLNKSIAEIKLGLLNYIDSVCVKDGACVNAGKVELDQSYRRYEMLGEQVRTEEEILHRIYSSFQFPEQYNETWEDIEKGLQDLSWTSHNYWEMVVWNSEQSFR